MKKIMLVAFSILLLASVCLAVDIPLKATWTPNTETDMAGYNLYRTDGTRTKLNTTLIAHPPTFPYLFNLTVAPNTQGTATFVLTALDTAGNESGDSNTANYPFDLKAPGAPAGLGVTK